MELSHRNQPTEKLIASIREKGSIALISIISELMPGGNPDFSIIRSRPSIEQMKSWPIDQGYGMENLHSFLSKLIRNYCSSINVPADKNMNEDQIVECAGFLLDECGTFRIEDYIMMFALAKRGKLVVGKTGKVFDRVDIAFISDIKDNYEHIRWEYGHSMLDQKKKIPNNKHQILLDEPEEVKEQRWTDAINMFNDMRRRWTAERIKEQDEIREQQLTNYKERKEKFESLIQEAKDAGYTDISKYVNDKLFEK